MISRARSRAAGRSGTPSVVQVWHDTWVALSAQPIPILTCALVGVAATSAIYPLLPATLQDFDDIRRLIKRHEAVRLTVLMLLLVIEMVARGMITRIALRGGTRSTLPCLWQVFTATIRRLHPLLFGALVYGIIMSVATGPISMVLNDVYLDQDHIIRAGILMPDYAHAVVQRDQWALLPNPGAPFVEWMALRHKDQWTAAWLDAGEYATRTSEPTQGDGHLAVIADSMLATHLNMFQTLSLLIFILAAETLLRFRIVMAFTASARVRRRVLPMWALVASARIGLRHFKTLALHIWLTRLVLFGIQAVFITLPIVLAQSSNVKAAFLRLINNGLFVDNPWVVSLSCGLVYAVLMAFSVVYDVKLFHTLECQNLRSDATGDA